MYKPIYFFIGRYFSGLVFMLFYPVLMVIVSFFWLSINVEYYVFFVFLLLAVMVNVVGCSLGYLIGVSVDNIFSARTLLNFIQIALL